MARQAANAVSAYLTGQIEAEAEDDARPGSVSASGAHGVRLYESLLALAKRADEEGERDLSAELVDLIAKHH